MRNDRAGGYAGLLLDGGFKIFRMQVESGSGDDDFTFAAQEAQLAGGLGLGQIACCKPLAGARMQRAAGPGGVGDGGAADHHLAVGAELYLAAGERLADGSLGYVERMVEGDQGGGFRHAVTLNDDQAECVPESLKRGRQRAAAGDERPELEAEGAMDIAEAPPFAYRVNAFCFCPQSGDVFSQAGEGGFEMGFEQCDGPAGRRRGRRCVRGGWFQ